MLFNQNQKKKAIIWDLGNTLIAPNLFKAIRINLRLIKTYGLKIFTIIIYNYYQDPKYIYKIFHDAARIPNSCFHGPMVNFFSGKKDRDDLYKQAIECIKKQENINKYQKILLKQTIDLIFNPNELAWCMSIINPTLELVKACFDKIDKNGFKQNELYILSNWDRESFNHLYKRDNLKKLFKYFKKEHIVISAETGLLKPHEEAYKNFLNYFNLLPENCIFLDDDLNNVQMAKNFGITAFQVIPNNYDFLRKELKKINVI